MAMMLLMMMVMMMMMMMLMMMTTMMMMMMMVLLQVFMLDQSAGTAQLQVFVEKIKYRIFLFLSFSKVS